MGASLSLVPLQQFFLLIHPHIIHNEVRDLPRLVFADIPRPTAEFMLHAQQEIQLVPAHAVKVAAPGFSAIDVENVLVFVPLDAVGVEGS